MSYIIRPSSTAATIVEKLSSIKIIEDASLVTSVPDIPIAIPISASFIAGASFTPSPVIATILPFLLNALTILNLWLGETLANTLTFFTFFSNSESSISSISDPVITWSSLLHMFKDLAIASAVFWWSPVIITGFIPASLHFNTASLASSLGGSILPATPMNIRCSSNLPLFVRFSSLYAAAIHLKALDDMAVINSSTCFFFWYVKGFNLLFSKT